MQCGQAIAASLAIAASVGYAAKAVRPLGWTAHQNFLHHRAGIVASSTEGAAPKTQFFQDQKLDHFEQSSKTWTQRFWVNDTFHTGGDAPVMVFISGEGAGAPYWVSESEATYFAEQYGGLVIELEHRFYGASFPTENASTENLRYLSSEQALADLAWFQLYAQKKLNVGPNAKWVTYGGSYAGALAAFARRKYSSIHAAVSASGPVQAQYDFEGYMDQVTESLGMAKVGGSEQCQDAVRIAFQNVSQVLSSGNKGSIGALSQRFKSCTPPLTADDQWLFSMQLTDAFAGTVQYNGEGQQYTIETLCQQMLLPAFRDPLDALVNVSNSVLGEEKCFSPSWDDYIKELSDETLAPETGVGIRQWTYQTCSQFGYYQACHQGDPDCAFNPQLGLDQFGKTCQQVFGISEQDNRDSIDFVNQYYGGNSTEAAGTRIAYTSGNVDPWHRLAVQRAPEGSEYVAVVVDGAAHCRTLYYPREDDPEPVKQAHKAIGEALAKWLA